MDIYIIVKQRFYFDGRKHHQIAVDNPIVSVYKSAAVAERVCKRLVERALQTFTHYTLKTSVPDSQFVCKYNLYDGTTCMISFIIVKEYAI